MSEQVMRKRVVKALRSLDAVSVENPARPGTPDVNYIEGWIELKQLSKWPSNADTDPVLVPLFTSQQKVWLRRRCRMGGTAFFLLQVGKDWLLFEGDVAADFVGMATRKGLFFKAYRSWEGKLNETELVECLRTYGSKTSQRDSDSRSTGTVGGNRKERLRKGGG